MTSLTGCRHSLSLSLLALIWGLGWGGGGGGKLGLILAGYVPLVSQSPYPIIVYSAANYTPHLSHFWANK